MTDTRRVYADHSSTTPVRPEVLEAMLPFYRESWGNPSSSHSMGREAKVRIGEARETVAGAIGAKPSEIIFTSGGTESDNIAVKGYALANRRPEGGHIVTSAIEHPAVLASCDYLAANGFDVTKVPVGADGVVNPGAARDAMRGDTILVTIMHANNEVGTIQPVSEIAAIAKEHGAAVHTDAVQSFLKTPVNVGDLGVDLLSVSAHKVNGPKGVGALYVRSGVRLQTLSHGGGHERGLRAGTENVVGIVGFAKAVEIGAEEIERNRDHVRALRDDLLRRVTETITCVRVNGRPDNGLPGVVNIGFEGADGEALLINLDIQGICVSAGSACHSGAMEPSPVLLAMGVPAEYINGSLRFSFGRENTEEDVDYIMERLPAIIARARGAS